MNTVQLSQLKESPFFKGYSFSVCPFKCDSGFILYFNVSDSTRGVIYTLVTQKNETRHFKSLDSVYSLLENLSDFNDLKISVNFKF